MLSLMLALVLSADGVTGYIDLASSIHLGSTPDEVDKLLPPEAKNTKYGRCSEKGCKPVEDEERASAMLSMWVVELDEAAIMLSVSFCGSKDHWNATSIEVRKLVEPIREKNNVLYSHNVPDAEVAKKCYVAPDTI